MDVFAPEDVKEVNKNIRDQLGNDAPQISITPEVKKPDREAGKAGKAGETVVVIRCESDGVCFRPMIPHVVEVKIGNLPRYSKTVFMPNGAPILSLP